MREIIYRAKRKDNNEWIYGYYLHQTNFYGEDCNKHYIINGNEHNSYDNVCEHYIIDEKTLGQYTGLKDKNENKIFEGDILKAMAYYKCRDRQVATEWTVEHKIHSTQSGFFTYGLDRRWFRPLTRSRLFNADAEIIGNIHDRSRI